MWRISVLPLSSGYSQRLSFSKQAGLPSPFKRAWEKNVCSEESAQCAMLLYKLPWNLWLCFPPSSHLKQGTHFGCVQTDGNAYTLGTKRSEYLWAWDVPREAWPVFCWVLITSASLSSSWRLGSRSDWKNRLVSLYQVGLALELAGVRAALLQWLTCHWPVQCPCHVSEIGQSSWALAYGNIPPQITEHSIQQKTGLIFPKCQWKPEAFCLIPFYGLSLWDYRCLGPLPLQSPFLVLYVLDVLWGFCASWYQQVRDTPSSHTHLLEGLQGPTRVCLQWLSCHNETYTQVESRVRPQELPCPPLPQRLRGPNPLPWSLSAMEPVIQ